jgi:uncharacterized protein YciI
MLFAWIGFLKPGANPIPQDVQQQTNDFLQQPYIRIAAMGQLRDGDSKRAGMMMLFEVDDRAKAEAFVANSPFLKAGLYERYHLFEYDLEVGTI